MATNDILLVHGTDIVLADITDYSPAAANNLGARTNQIDMTSLAAGAARQSDKFDFGAAFARRYILSAAIEYSTAPAAGEMVDFYIGFSNSATAANANPGNLSGSDGAYTGYSSNLADSLKQLTHIGSMILTVQATGTIQIQTSIGILIPTARYGCLVVVNSSAADAFHSDMVESAILIAPFKDQIQAAA
jgi:hypothetical protein